MFTALLLLLTGCSSMRYFHEDEKKLGSRGEVLSLHHIAAYYPSRVSLNSPGYLVGLEDSRPSRVANPGDLILEPITYAGSGIARIENQLVELKLPYISQLYRYTGNRYGEGNCALYNLYRSASTPTIEPCADAPDETRSHTVNHKSAYRDSWQAIDLLKRAVDQELASGAYTHLVVAMMGLDTTQEEAMGNFNSLIWSIRQSAGDAFRPLLIGITWPSVFHGRWADPIWEGVAYPYKADEADMLGLSWIGVILHEVVIPASERITTVALTHSFGARAISMGSCIGPAIKRSADTEHPRASGHLNYLFGFAPAFSMQRFNRKPFLFNEDIYYHNRCQAVERFVLTATAHDTASQMTLWANLASNYHYYDYFCQRPFPLRLSCVSTDQHGNLTTAYDREGRIIYLDTTQLMRYNAPATQGGAHSDIFRREIGQMIWQLLSE